VTLRRLVGFNNTEITSCERFQSVKRDLKGHFKVTDTDASFDRLDKITC